MIKKKIIAVLLVVAFLISIVPGAALAADTTDETSTINNYGTAAAAVTISGASTVLAGGTYTYTVTVSSYASSIGGKILCGGIFTGSTATFWQDSVSGRNESVSATATITVTANAGAAPGAIGTITVDGKESTFDGTTVHENIIGTTRSVPAAVYAVSYQSHVESIGWQGWRSNGEASGTSAQALRLEAMKIYLQGVSGGIEYRTHVQNIGWMGWVANGALSGTEARSLRLEAIEMRLTGAAASQYDIYYRVHAQNVGWMDWAANGASSGTAGFAYRLEAIEIQLVPKGGAAPGPTARPFVQMPTVSYQSHVQNIGWQTWKGNGDTSGTSGQSLRLEAMRIVLGNADGGIQYKTHVQNIGWMNWVSNGAGSGTEGLSYRLEAIQIQLTGAAASLYDVYYRVHAQYFGWMGWAKNGGSSGTAGYSYRLEAIQIQLVPKGAAAPGSTANSFRAK